MPKANTRKGHPAKKNATIRHYMKKGKKTNNRKAQRKLSKKGGPRRLSFKKNINYPEHPKGIAPLTPREMLSFALVRR